MVRKEAESGAPVQEDNSIGSSITPINWPSGFQNGGGAVTDHDDYYGNTPAAGEAFDAVPDCVVADIYRFHPGLEDDDPMDAPDNCEVPGDHPVVMEPCDFEPISHGYLERVQTYLLVLMKRFQCPLEPYDAIMDCAEFATSEPSFDFRRGPVGNKRGSVVAALTKKMGMEGLRPFVSEVVVPTHAKPVEIVRFRFSHALDSMFSDRSLMKPPNLVINQPSSGKDPYALYESPGNLLNKVHSGSSFQNAYWYKIKDPSCQFLIFLIFFIDKTGIDGMQRFGLEPLRFTPSIFKRGVRVHSFAWRTLGYVPDLYKGSSAINKQHKPVGVDSQAGIVVWWCFHPFPYV